MNLLYSNPIGFEEERLHWGALFLKLRLTQKLSRPSPLTPLPKRERGIRKISHSPSPRMGEGVGGCGQFGFCVSPNHF